VLRTLEIVDEELTAALVFFIFSGRKLAALMAANDEEKNIRKAKELRT
jgi:hypothetical protein